jgi:hypothetical protein
LLETPGPRKVLFQEVPRAEPQRLKDGSIELDFGFMMRTGGVPISWTRGSTHKEISAHFQKWRYEFKHWGTWEFDDPSTEDEIEQTQDKEPDNAPDSSQSSQKTVIQNLRHKVQEMKESLLELKREKKEVEKQHKKEINKLLQQHKKELEKAAIAYAEDTTEGEEAIGEKAKMLMKSWPNKGKTPTKTTKQVRKSKVQYPSLPTHHQNVV